jgi:drug/metabolite transporter (DMT)-like permease
VFRAAAPAWQLGRGIAMLGSALLFIFATRYLPIADATATGFVSPAFITALAIPMLGERVGRQRWAAIAVGLAGVLVITRPGGSGFHWASLLPVASASSWALAVVVTRRMGGRDGMLTTLGYTALIGFAGISCLMPLVAVWPSPQQAALGLLIGASTAAGQYLILIAYRSTDASLLALIVGSGLSIALGERRRPFYPKTAAA